MSTLGPTTNHEEIRQWALRRGAVPVELLPHLVDGEPAILHFMLAEQPPNKLDIRVLPWEEFFAKFDGLKLTFVYDRDDGPYYEILEAGGTSSFNSPEYRPETYLN